MVMIMKRIKHIKKRRISQRESAPVSVSFLLMAFCYFIGCMLGSRFGMVSEIPGTVFSILTESSASTENGFLAVFGSYGFYGLLFLLLSTTYLGFLLVPPVFALKGFLIGTLFLTYLQSGQQRPYLLAGIAENPSTSKFSLIQSQNFSNFSNSLSSILVTDSAY